MALTRPEARDTGRAMSRENVEVVRGIWEADRRRDLDAVRAAYAADVEWEDNTGLWGYWGIARGPDGIEAAWRRWYEAFEDVRFQRGEVADAGDAVIVTYRTYGRGRGSGAVVDQAITLLWTLRAGRSCTSVPTRIEPKPSKPPGCGSRQVAFRRK